MSAMGGKLPLGNKGNENGDRYPQDGESQGDRDYPSCCRPVTILNEVVDPFETGQPNYVEHVHVAVVVARPMSAMGGKQTFQRQ